MQIQYLKILQKYPEIVVSEDFIVKLEGISEAEIFELETKYNSGTPFPVALKELLFLAGQSCYVLDYGLAESQDELQEFVRENIRDYSDLIIARPFYAIDVYGASDQFLFVYLDSNDPDPSVYWALYHFPMYRTENIGLGSEKLSVYIEKVTKRLLSGQNPY